MENLPFINTIVSALLYVVALWFPFYTGPLAFCSFIPLAYTSYSHKVSWRNGIVWGLIFWGGHLYAFFNVLYEHGTFPTLINCIPYALLVIYFTLLTILWFLCMQYFSSFSQSPQFALAIFIIITNVYLYGIENYALWLFDVREGYPFSSPLLPIAQYNYYSTLLPRSVFFATLLCLCMVALVPVLKLYKTIFFIGSISLLIIFNYCRITRIPQEPPPWLSKLLVLSNNPAQTYHYCHDALVNLKKQLQRHNSGNATIIIMPESAISYCLNTVPHLLPLITQSLLPSQTFIIGAHYRQITLYNCMYILSPTRTNYQFYCKNHGVPFFERVPTYFNTLFFRRLFLHTKEPFAQAQHIQEPIDLPEIGPIIPYICSDLFFAPHAPSCPDQFPLLAVCNDFWFSQQYLRQLMILNARLKAYSWNRTIIYVSYYYNSVLSPLSSWNITRCSFK